MLIVEQNVRQVLRVVDRAYLLEAGSIRASGTAAELLAKRNDPRSLSRSLTGSTRMFGIFDIYLLEALINGVLLGGVLALLALGLNLIFGVIDVVWICYAELIMLGMYGMYYLYVGLSPAVPAGGGDLHRRRRRAGRAAASARDRSRCSARRRSTSCSPPAACCSSCKAPPRCCSASTSAISASACRCWRSPACIISYARLLAFGAALAGMVALYLFLARTYTGTAIRAIAQDRQIMPLMGVDTRRIYIITSAIGGALAGLAACLLVLQYDVHPFIGLTFGPITFMICVLGGLGNMIGGFVAAFIFAEIISVGGLYLDLEWGYVFAFVFFIVMMFVRPQGLLARRS